MLNSITEAERTWSCQLNMKKTRNGTKVMASTISDTELAFRLTMSVQVLDWRTVTVFLSASDEGITVSVVCSICSACSRTRPIICWILALYWGSSRSTRLNSSHLGISYAVFCL